MPTRQPPRRLNALPQQKNDELGISIKGSDILKRNNSNCKTHSVYKPHPLTPPPPSTPRILVGEEANKGAPGEEKQQQLPGGITSRPPSSVRRLVPGDITVPTIEESTADVLEMTRNSRLKRRESADVDSIKNLFAGIMSGEIAAPGTRSVACSPLSNWSQMSEDLLEHVSQRVVTEQQMNAGSRNSLRDPPRAATSLISPGVHVTSPAAHVNPSSRAATPKSVSRPPSRASNLSSLSTIKCDRPRTSASIRSTLASSASRKRPNIGRVTPGSRPPSAAVRAPSAAVRPPTAAAVRPPTGAARPSTAAAARPPSARPGSAWSRDLNSFRESLSETGISLPQRAVEKLMSSYERETLCSRQSNASTAFSADTLRSSPLYNVVRQTVNQGYEDMLNAFQVYDKNNKGAVSREDFKRVLKHFTVDLTRNQVEVLLNRSDLVSEWLEDRIPYKSFLKKYMERGRSGYVKHMENSDRPQTGDTEFADIAEARLFAQLHSDFVNVLEKFRSHDTHESGCIPYSDFKNIMSDFGLKMPSPEHEEDVVNYVDYLNSVTALPSDLPQTPASRDKSRPQTAPAAMALSHVYTAGESDPDTEFQSLSLNLQPVHQDPRQKALVKIENCKVLNGGTRKPGLRTTIPNSIQGQINKKFGSDTTALRRVMQHYDTGRDGNINIATFRDLLTQLNIKVDENEFYHVVSTYDSAFKGVIPYKKFLCPANQAC